MKWAVWVLAALLTACASPGLQPTQVSTVQAEGRLSLTSNGRSDRGGFVWTYAPPSQSWRLFGPTGTRVGELTETPQLARWQPEKGTPVEAENLSMLVARALGVEAPLSRAPAWLMTREPMGLDDSRQEGDWRIQVKRRDTQGFPELIDLSHPDHRIRMKINTWQGR